MKIKLVEELTAEVKSFISLFGTHQTNLQKFFNTNSGIFNDAKGFVKYCYDKQLVNVLSSALELTKRDSRFKDAQSELFESTIETKYPSISKNIIALKTIVQSMETDGFFFDDSDKLNFTNQFLDKFLSKLDELHKEDANLADELFTYLFVNYKQNNVTLQDIRVLLNNAQRWFSNLNKSDLKYKLDVYLWIQHKQNLRRYNIPVTFSFTSKVKQGSKVVDISDGIPFYTFTAGDMRAWLNQFTIDSDQTMSIFDVFAEQNLTNGIDSIRSEYYRAFRRIDPEATEQIFSNLEKLAKEKRLDYVLKTTYISEDARPEDIFNALKKSVAENSVSFDEQSKKKEQRQRNLSGIQVVKQIRKFNPKQNLDMKTLQDFVYEIAVNNRLITKYKKINWTALVKELQKPLKYSTLVPGSEVVALKEKIIMLLKLS